MLPVCVADPLATLNFRLTGFDRDLCLQAGFTIGIVGPACREALVSRFQSLTGLPQPQANSRSIAFDQFIDEVASKGQP
jgi:hypothetical protein